MATKPKPRPATAPTRVTSPDIRPLHVAFICGALLLIFAITSYSATRQKSATFDEPMHAVAAITLTQHGDYRINPEDPPLWQRWVALAVPADALRVNLQSELFQKVFENKSSRWHWAIGTLYLTPGNDADGYLIRLRIMLILLGATLGAVVALWSWRLAGAPAAIAAALLVALDPNLLAHAATIKNDVAITLIGAALAYATWRAGIRLTWLNALAVVLLAAIAPVLKFSGPLLWIVFAGLLALRAADRRAWTCFGLSIKTRLAKSGVALVLLIATACVAYLLIWANYSFRYAPTPDGRSWDLAEIANGVAANGAAALQITDHRAPRSELPEPTEEEIAAWKQPLTVKALLFIDRHHLLPQTWTYGMLYTYRSTLLRLSFLRGQTSYVGFPGYFLWAFLYKAPIALQLALVAALITLCSAFRSKAQADFWSLICITVPLLILGAAIFKSNLNIGVRHMLPIFPFLYLTIATAAAYVWRRWPKNGRVLLLGLAGALAVETATAFPNYLAFFNVAAGGARHGIHLLSDSNLDWGQDLPLLADWQRQHPEKNLYLCYFGTADPEYYHIKYAPLPGTNSLKKLPPESATQLPLQPGVFAISATALQGLYLDPAVRKIYAPLRHQPPLDVLGGTIYLFEYDPR